MSAEIKLVEIASFSAFWALRKIQVAPEQRRFTKNIVLSFLQTRHPAVTTYRIDAAGEPIGYVMLIHAENPTQWIIERLTIDQDQQRKGYAYAVCDQLIDMVHGFENSEMVIARYEPENNAAKALFAGFRFVEQEKMFRGRHIAVLEFEFDDDDDEDDEYDDEYDDEEEDDDEYDDEEDAAVADSDGGDKSVSA